MLPRLPGLKQATFCKRLVLFNEAFTPVGRKSKGKVSHQLECYGMKPSREDLQKMYLILSFSFYPKIVINNFVFWADNFSGQNKNWFLYTVLVNEVNRTNGTTNELTIKYFEPGHTFMSADDFHNVIKQGMRIKAAY